MWKIIFTESFPIKQTKCKGWFNLPKMNAFMLLVLNNCLDQFVLINLWDSQYSVSVKKIKIIIVNDDYTVFLCW